MSWRDSLHSRVVAWLKIVLPLAALALLSTLFLLSRNVTPAQDIPFSSIDLEERARGQQVTAPSFAGASARGDLIALTAATARPVEGARGRLEVADLDATIDLVGGARITLGAASGSLDDPGDMVLLQGGVEITSSTGYRITAQDLRTGLRTVRAETDRPVQAEGPPGRFSAGAMRLDADPEGKSAHLVFTNGVKLVYTPSIE